MDDENLTPDKPERRRDRLMSAKDRAQQEADQWREIEQSGSPVPAAPRPSDPPPVEPAPPPAPQASAEPEPPAEPASAPSEASAPQQPQPSAEAPPKGSPRPPLPYPHPTDPPAKAGHPTSGAFAAQPVKPVELPPEPAPAPPQAEGGKPDTPTPSGMPTPVEPLYRRPTEEVRLDADGMPLPKKVSAEDFDATTVGRSAFQDEIAPPPEASAMTQAHGYKRPELGQTVQSRRPTEPSAPAAPPPARPAIESRAGRIQPSYAPPAVSQPAPPPRAAEQPKPKKKRQSAKERRRQSRRTMGCVTRAAALIFIGLLVMGMMGGGGAAVYYAQVTGPSFRGISTVEDLQERALQFETTRIRDSEGNILYQINDPEGGLRDYVTLDEVSPWVIVATVATEEREFFTNPGFSVPAIVRAMYQNYQEGELVSGASTITQQLTRALLLPEDERTERSYERKVKEIFLASELERRFSKREVLELYLNQIYYGNLAYGIEAAAQTYFDKPASDLTLAEAAFLAGIPQAPAVWDPVRDREAALNRQQQVFSLMLEAGCIDTGRTDIELPCTTQAELQAAAEDVGRIANTTFEAPDFSAKYPHWVFYIIQQLEADPTLGPAIYTSGFDVYTTIDPRIQDAAQEQVDLVLSGLADRNVTNASVVVIEAKTGAILAMVGSRDFFDESIDGQVNIALTPQQPGSSIKPFTYLTAFRNGWTPATVIWDVPIEYAIPGFGVYEPVNYDGRFRGPVTVREALSNSLNIPAVLTLDYVGVPALLETLNDVGITSLGDETNPNNYGLSLTLGAGEVYLLEWTNAFATVANGGRYRPVYGIERVERDGQVIEGYPYQVPEGEQVLDPADTYLLQDILADTEARIPSFGRETPLSPPYPAGAKTGTTNDFRDNWTMGFTSEVAVGVWVGNTDNSEMINVTGVTGAGPIWRGVMDASAEFYPPQPFTLPGSAVFEQTVCRDDGAIPSDYCLEHSNFYIEIFNVNTPPPQADEGLYRTLRVDRFTNLLANDNCPDFTEERAFLVVPNPSQLIDVREDAYNWLRNTETGRSWAQQRALDVDQLQMPPTDACTADTPRPNVRIDLPEPGSTQSGILIVSGAASVPDFDYFIVEYGLGPDPGGWAEVQGRTSVAIDGGPLGQLNLTDLPDGDVTIRLLVFDNQGRNAEERVTFRVDNPDDGGDEDEDE